MGGLCEERTLQRPEDSGRMRPRGHRATAPKRTLEDKDDILGDISEPRTLVGQKLRGWWRRTRTQGSRTCGGLQSTWEPEKGQRIGQLEPNRTRRRAYQSFPSHEYFPDCAFAFSIYVLDGGCFILQMKMPWWYHRFHTMTHVRAMLCIRREKVDRVTVEQGILLRNPPS